MEKSLRSEFLNLHDRLAGSDVIPVPYMLLLLASEYQSSIAKKDVFVKELHRNLILFLLPYGETQTIMVFDRVLDWRKNYG